MALDLPLPKCVFAHGWWTSDGQKMSKSLGNFISREVIAEICRDYSVDVYRYYLLRAVAFGQDGDFSADMLKQKYNSDLANGIGNLLSRTTNMIGRYFDSRVPDGAAAPAEAASVRQAAERLADDVPGLMETCQFNVVLDRILALADATNKFIDDTAPFKLAKDPAQRDRLGGILYTCAEAVRIALLYLQPFMPATCEKGLERLGWTQSAAPLTESGRWGVLPAGATTQAGDGLFPRKQ
jgi:methionyl-tRNA synthetase